MLDKETLAMIEKAIRDAKSEHGDFPTNAQRGMMLIVEEVGEAVKEVVDQTRYLRAGEPAPPDTIIEELAQVAGLCMEMIKTLKENGVKDA